MLSKEIEICEKLGWILEDYGDDIQLRQESPLGEDFNFTVEKENFAYNVGQYALEFDPDEHCKMWIDNMGRVAGVPQSIRALLKDADDIGEMLEDLADALRKNYNKERRKNA